MEPKITIKRARTGCIPCRLSKKKCDEIKPICSSCTKKGLSCVWPEIPSQTLHQYINKKGLGEFAEHITKRVKRTRSGCDQCRKIKKKCDESMPICRRCAKKGIECTLQGRVRSNEPGSPLSNPSAISSANGNEIECAKPYLLAKNTSIKMLDDIPMRINDGTSEMYLFNIFFDNIIVHISPKETVKFIADIAFATLKDSQEFRSVITSLAAAFMCTTDGSSKMLLDGIQNKALSTALNWKTNNSRIVELKLQLLVFCILRTWYTKTDNRASLIFINKALDVISQHNPAVPSSRFKILVESIIYHFAVSFIALPKNLLDNNNPFIICDAIRSYYPETLTLNPNSLLGPALDIFIIVAKVSYLFKKENVSLEMISLMQEQVDSCLSLMPVKLASFTLPVSSQHKFQDIDAPNIVIPVFLSPYITILACKLLLLHLISPNSDDFNMVVEKMLSTLRFSRDCENEFVGCSQWGLFMLGLNLQRIEDQNFIVSYFIAIWEKSHNLGYLKSISLLKHAWKKGSGLDILREEEFFQQVSLH